MDLLIIDGSSKPGEPRLRHILRGPGGRKPDDHDNGRALFRNLAAGGASSLFKAGLQLAMLPLMGRLLGPHEFGLYATVLPIVTFFTVVADGGFGASLAKEDSGDRTIWTTAFYVMLALGCALCIVVNVSGLVLARLMGEPRLYALMAVLSVSFLFIGVSTLPAARIFRRNDLVMLSAIETLASLVGAVFAVVFALRGFGAMSLAVQGVATYSIRALCLNAAAFELPGRTFAFRALVEHLNTGGILVGTRLIDMFCRFAENVLFSLAFGPAALGSYTFANQISRFLCESASNPVWSATYAQSLRLTGHPFANLIANMAQLIMLATFPAACIVAVAAPAVFPVLLGSKWEHAGPFLQILICSYSFAAAASVGTAALLATGQNKLFLWTGVFLSASRVAAVAAGPWIGAMPVVTAIAIVNLLYALVMTTIVNRLYAVAYATLRGAVSSALIAGIASALACLATLRLLPHAVPGLVASLLVGGAVLLTTLLTIDRKFALHVKRSIAMLRVQTS